MSLPDVPLEELPEVVEYISADGLHATLVVERGATGRMMPPVDIWEDVVPLTPGSRYRGARHAARSFVLPVVTAGNRYGREQLRQLARVLDPLRGMGRIRLMSGPGTGREINCVYQAGLDSLKEDYPHWSRAALQFRATDPYWGDGIENLREFSAAALETEWFPIFPLDLSTTNVRGEFSITNSGDAWSWPSTEVTGPGADFTFDNRTTGGHLFVAGEVPAGRTLIITSTPGARSVSLDNGDNWFSRLDRGSTLWGFVPGLNQLRVTYATEAGRLTIRWRLRYLTP